MIGPGSDKNLPAGQCLMAIVVSVAMMKMLMLVIALVMLSCPPPGLPQVVQVGEKEGEN